MKSEVGLFIFCITYLSKFSIRLQWKKREALMKIARKQQELRGLKCMKTNIDFPLHEQVRLKVCKWPDTEEPLIESRLQDPDQMSLQTQQKKSEPLIEYWMAEESCWDFRNCSTRTDADRITTARLRTMETPEKRQDRRLSNVMVKAQLRAAQTL